MGQKFEKAKKILSFLDNDRKWKIKWREQEKNMGLHKKNKLKVHKFQNLKEEKNLDPKPTAKILPYFLKKEKVS